MMYIYRDVKPNRPSKNNLDPRMFIIANDVDHPINVKASQVAEHKNLSILRWSNKNQIKTALTT